MRWLTFVLLLLLGLLQYRLWFADGSLAERHRLEAKLTELQRVNKELRERNAVLERDVMELKTGNAGIEERARSELGMIREGEIFYQLVAPGTEASPPTPAAAPEAPVPADGAVSR